MKNTKYFVVLVTVAARKEAIKISRVLVKEKLAACANIIDNIKSVYWWQGKIEHGNELLLIIKTTKDKLTNLIIRVKQLHSYTVPEIIALPIEKGNPSYLSWISESVIFSQTKKRGKK